MRAILRSRHVLAALSVLGLAVPSVVGPARSAGAAEASSETPVPILMYHVLGDPPAGAPYPELYVRASDFAGQMRGLEQAGFGAVTLRQVWDHWHRGTPLPRKPIVVSFDDGYGSTADVALPVLRAHGWPGVLNLKVRSLERSWGLRPRQVCALIGAGWEIDAHTISHPDLTTVDGRGLALEVGGSRRVLRSTFGVPVDFFCYPAGKVRRPRDRSRQARRLPRSDDDARRSRGAASAVRARRVRVDRSDGVVGFLTELDRLLARIAP